MTLYGRAKHGCSWCTGRFHIRSQTYPEGKIQWGYVYGTAYVEVKRVLIQRKAEAGFYNLNRTDLTFEALAEVWLHSCGTV